MASTWNDDDRSCVVSYSSSKGPVYQEKSLGEVLKEYHKEEKDRLYTNDATTSPKQEYHRNKSPVAWVDYVTSEEDEMDIEPCEEDPCDEEIEEKTEEETNAVLEEKVLYKKFWYV